MGRKLGFFRGAGFQVAAALAAGAFMAPQGALAQGNRIVLPAIDVSASRLGAGIVGASTTVITAEDIERSPESTLPELLGKEAGVQTRSLFGGANGTGSTVDVRGFGATAQSNTLVLINGRRLNDIDMAAVDLSTIPLNSIERVEITRGNSGAVLYGDNAVGGVINIVTKSGPGRPNTFKTEAALGSHQFKEGRLSLSRSSGAYSASVYGNVVDSGGYRINNNLAQQNGVADIRYSGDTGDAYLTLSADSQKLGFPGERNVTLTTSELAADRRGTTSPFDFGNKQGFSVTAGVTRKLTPDIELILDGGFRQRRQQAGFFGGDGTPFNYVDTVLSIGSITPRAKIDTPVFGIPSRIIAGIDYYNSAYDSDRPLFEGAAPIHRYDLAQWSLAGYWQQTLSLTADTDVSFGFRHQRTHVSARDTFDLGAPGAVSCFPPFGCFPAGVEGAPLDKDSSNNAYHLGFEHRFSSMIAVFGRTGRAFRTPNVDERVGMAPFLTPTTFDLETQTSWDIEGGVRFNWNRFDIQVSVYEMQLENELFFNPVLFINYNLDPTRRTGVETAANWRLTDAVALKGSLTYTRAEFREGPFAGNRVPLVSPVTASLGISWDIWEKYLTFDSVVSYAGKRRMENDQANFQPQIPAHTLVDVRLGGKIDRFFWSFTVQNLFDEEYFDYAAASAAVFGTYNAYPQPGRTFMLRAGAALE